MACSVELSALKLFQYQGFRQKAGIVLRGIRGDPRSKQDPSKMALFS